MLKLILHPYKLNKVEYYAVMFNNLPNLVFQVTEDFNAGLYQRLTSQAEVIKQLKKDGLNPVCVFVVEPSGAVALVDFDINCTIGKSRTKQAEALTKALPIAKLLVGGYISTEVGIGLAAEELAVKSLRSVAEVLDAVKQAYSSMRNAFNPLNAMTAFMPTEEDTAVDTQQLLQASTTLKVDYSTLPDDLHLFDTLFKHQPPTNKQLIKLVKMMNEKYQTDIVVSGTLSNKRESFLVQVQSFLLMLATQSNDSDVDVNVPVA